ncbi:phosducin-like protein 1 [Lycorma delicatula]|uniref:phosducin-like protein 1 n=1 Tax=Lycorma delicatula TaxID=130591 RepID=UPI003F514CBA
MATLEDKILGEKKHYYCSSSSSSSGGEESDDELENASEGASSCCKSDGSSTSFVNGSEWNGVSSNTGPKGVIKDWQRFKQLESKKRSEQEKGRLSLIKKCSLTCRTAKEEEEEEIGELEKEFDEMFTDKFLEQYRKQRMNEMLSNKLPVFGKLIHLRNGDEFLEALDNENKSVAVVVHVYEDNISGCKMMNKCLAELSTEYPNVKFCKLVSSTAGMSSHFKSDGVPALLIYKGGQMVGNFIRVTDELGDEFFAGDVENYLIEHGMINDKSCVPKIISQSEQSSDSDGLD